MELTDLLTSRAHRKLKQLDNYREITDPNSLSDFFGTLDLRKEEKILGFYSNVAGENSETIVVTTRGLHIYSSNKWQKVDYRSIKKIETPPADKKRNVSQLVIQLKSNENVILPIHGGKDGTRDAWSFLTFLMRAIEDIKNFDSQT